MDSEQHQQDRGAPQFAWSDTVDAVDWEENQDLAHARGYLESD